MSKLMLDFGSGPNPIPGYAGVDRFPFDGKVSYVLDVTARKPARKGERWGRFKPWPWKTNSVAAANASHFVEHLTNLDDRWERVWFFNELWRVLVPGGTATIVLPHWCSTRYYGDPTHKEPWSEMGFYYLDRQWRQHQAPHADAGTMPDGYSCDFTATWGYSLHPAVAVRNAEFQQFAVQFYKESCQDVTATLTARK